MRKGDVSGTRQIHRRQHQKLPQTDGEGGNDVSVYFHSFLLCKVSFFFWFSVGAGY